MVGLVVVFTVVAVVAGMVMVFTVAALVTEPSRDVVITDAARYRCSADDRGLCDTARCVHRKGYFA